MAAGRRARPRRVRQVREAALEAQSHQDLPFEQLVSALDAERVSAENPLFQVMYNHASEESGSAAFRLGDLVIDDYPLTADLDAQFELTVTGQELSGGGIDVSFTYARPLFRAETVKRLLEQYVALLEAFCRPDSACLGNISLLTEAECQRLAGWEACCSALHSPVPVHRLFERQARAGAERVALQVGTETGGCVSLRYGELDRLANGLAHQLVSEGVVPGTRIGIAAERGFAQIVGMLAILKAGASYVPLDLKQPEERLMFQVRDSRLVRVLVDAALRTSVPGKLLDH